MTRTVLALRGETLFHLATLYLRDATQWVRIATINNVQDPFLESAISLMIPDLDQSDGNIGGR